MGCLSANITSLHQPLNGSIRRVAQRIVARISLYAPVEAIPEPMLVSITRIPTQIIQASVKLCNASLQCNVQSLTRHLDARIGLVCSAATELTLVEWSEDTVVFTNDDLGIVKVAYLSADSDWQLKGI